MLGQGLYDAAEVSLLTGVPVERVVRWANDSARGPAVLSPTFDPMFGFADLISARVAEILHDRGISDASLRRGVETLRERTGLDRPLANQDVIDTLATSGTSFLALEGDEYVDIGLKRQGVIQEVARIDLRTITFDSSGGPVHWVPVPGVVLDPTVQAGAPCVEGTRIPTRVIVGLLDDADHAEVAWEFDLSVEAVKVAEAFEELLASGVGLPV